MNVLTIINLTTGSSSFVAAALPADAEQHRGGAQLDNHLPDAHGHHEPLPEPRQGGETVVGCSAV